VERVIASDGFEKILATDYKKSPESTVKEQFEPPAPTTNKRMSLDFGLPKLKSSASSSVASPQPDKKNNRLSFSLASLWSGGPKSPPIAQNPNLKPLHLAASQNGSGVLKRSAEDEDDEEDARQRVRLNAELKLMGIEARKSPLPFLCGNKLMDCKQPGLQVFGRSRT
jgi:hypothetical protein